MPIFFIDLLLIYWGFLYDVDLSPFLDTCIANISSHSVFFLFTLLIMPFDEYTFLLIIFPNLSTFLLQLALLSSCFKTFDREILAVGKNHGSFTEN